MDSIWIRQLTGKAMMSKEFPPRTEESRKPFLIKHKVGNIGKGSKMVKMEKNGFLVKLWRPTPRNTEFWCLNAREFQKHDVFNKLMLQRPTLMPRRKRKNYLLKGSDVFVVLEKQHSLKGKNTSKPSRLQRRLMFDTVQEILN
ncbi:hypothetical protein Fmac_009284 [Flemingia macrophylla]|uniref:Uncharacterized protein n=1 Tax=Flemingia macrophylla TaxID=520843 RepID=A0ABD1MZT3_9FABA